MEWVNRFVLNPLCLVIYHLLPRILFASNTLLRRTIQKTLKLTCFARALVLIDATNKPRTILLHFDSTGPNDC